MGTKITGGVMLAAWFWTCGNEPKPTVGAKAQQERSIAPAVTLCFGRLFAEATMAMDIASKVKTFHAALDRGMQ